MGLFVAANVVEGKLPPSVMPWFYIGKVVVTAGAAFWASRAWRSALRLDRTAWLAGIAVGVLGLGIWLLLDLVPYPRLGERSGFNPFEKIADPALRSVFLATRFLGLAALVPVIEEVFWRGFGLRYAADQDRWNELPMGTATPAGIAIVSAVFALAHPEWLAALVYGVLMAVLLQRTNRLGACLVAHASTNLLLGLWVVVRGAWHLW